MSRSTFDDYFSLFCFCVKSADYKNIPNFLVTSYRMKKLLLKSFYGTYIKQASVDKTSEVSDYNDLVLLKSSYLVRTLNILLLKPLWEKTLSVFCG